MPGTLYVVATPIGNLSDITNRAAETLGAVDAVLCEDTRVTGRLMNAIGAKKPLVSLHQHSSAKKMQELVDRLERGESLALVTDAGTPGISDPGGMFVEAAYERFGADARIEPIPGPSAVTAALSISGFPADKFAFLGFPPQKKGRKAYFDRVAAESETVAFYESTHRILKTLGELGEKIGGRPVFVARELTKLHETHYRGTVGEVLEQLETTSTKGEFVVVVRGK